MRIDRLTEGGLERAARLYSAVFNEEPWHESWPADVALQRLSELHRTPGCLALLLSAGSRPAGLAIGILEQRHDGRMLLLREFLIASEYRRQGAGGRLLEAMLDLAIASGADQCALATTAGTAAEGFYRRHGFQTASRELFLTRAL